MDVEFGLRDLLFTAAALNTRTSVAGRKQHTASQYPLKFKETRTFEGGFREFAKKVKNLTQH